MSRRKDTEKRILDAGARLDRMLRSLLKDYPLRTLLPCGVSHMALGWGSCRG